MQPLELVLSRGTAPITAQRDMSPVVLLSLLRGWNVII